MAKARNIQVPQTVQDGANDVAIRFYVTAAGAPRVEVQFPTNVGAPVTADRPISDFATLTGAQKTTLRALLTAIRDEALALEGFA